MGVTGPADGWRVVRYLRGMRYPDGGGLDAAERTRREQVRLPYSLYAFRFMWSKIIVFGHNLAIYFGVLLYFEIWPGHAALYALPGFVILAANGMFAATYLGVISARFRDVPQITASLVQIAFFVTPIMWKPEFLGNRQLVAELNPFFHLMEIVRAPLLGKIPTPDNYIAVTLITTVNLLLAGFFFARYRARISFWV